MRTFSVIIACLFIFLYALAILKSFTENDMLICTAIIATAAVANVIVYSLLWLKTKESVNEMKNSTKVAEKHVAVMTQPILGLSVKPSASTEAYDFYLINEGGGAALNIAFEKAFNKTRGLNVSEHVLKDVAVGKFEHKLTLLGPKSETRFLFSIRSQATGEIEKGLIGDEYEFEVHYTDIGQDRNFITRLSGKPLHMRLEYGVEPAHKLKRKLEKTTKMWRNPW